MRPDAVLVFARAPVPGQVKTRLEPVLGPAGCARLHRALVKHAIDMAMASRASQVELWCTPDTSHPFFRDLASRTGIRLAGQRGKDLGRRMWHALSAALLEHGAVVLTGSDSPVLDERYLNEAFTLLDGDADMVLGPAEDGGYGLVGATRVEPGIFGHIAWGGSRVLEQTLQALERSTLDCRLLDRIWDVDRPDDLRRLTSTHPELLAGLAVDAIARPSGMNV